MYILSVVHPLKNLCSGKGLAYCSKAVCLNHVCFADLRELVLAGMLLPPSSKPVSQSSKSALAICLCLQIWLCTTVSVASSCGKGNLPPPRGEQTQNPCQ